MVKKEQYERLLRYVYIGEIFVNFALVNEGYAWAITYPPDIKYSSQLVDAEKSARDNNRGCLWSYPNWADSIVYLQAGCFFTILITYAAHMMTQKYLGRVLICKNNFSIFKNI